VATFSCRSKTLGGKQVGMTESELREQLVRFARQMSTTGLVRGTSGNLSTREPGGETCVITPSGVDYDTMRPEDAVLVDLFGRPVSPSPKPSVDTPIHVAIYRARSDAGGCVHTHSLYAAAFSAVGREIPPLITESAGYLGGPVRVLDYIPPAQPDTGEIVAAGLGSDRAVLLPNHGVIAVGETLKKAFNAAMAVEESAHVAYIAIQLGKPSLVSDAEVSRMHEFIHFHYGQR
jgi:L-ribulose-5-phosphate 4-epimerase